MANLRLQSDEINVTDMLKKAEEDKYCKLECDSTCAVTERNRNFAEALGISTGSQPNISQEKIPETLKQAFMHYPVFVRENYSVLEDMINDLEKSRNQSLVHNFPPMRSDLRQVIHELAILFNCKSHSVDQEPSRSVIVKAVKGKARLPPNSIMDIMKDKVLTLKKPVVPKKKEQEPKKVIDYFDFDGKE